MAEGNSKESINQLTDFKLPFDLKLCDELDKHALLICQKYNFGNDSDWFGSFRGGLHGFSSRINGVSRHYYKVHEWSPSPKVPAETEYHLSAILFNMDSAIECFTFALNALGNSVRTDEFRDITDSKSLRRIRPSDISGEPDRSPPLEPLSGYTRYFPWTQSLWSESRQLMKTIFDHHDVSKHRETIFTGGKLRNDPPEGHLKTNSNSNEPMTFFIKAMFTPMAEIYLTRDPKAPRLEQRSVTVEGRVLLEEVADEFCNFINKTVVAATTDALSTIVAPVKEFKSETK